jgi:DNA-binding XRE family transcriptional regulator
MRIVRVAVTASDAAGFVSNGVEKGQRSQKWTEDRASTLMTTLTTLLLPMSSPARLAAQRKECGFTQQQMADKIGMHVSHLDEHEREAVVP